MPAVPPVLPVIIIETLPSGMLLATVNGDRLTATPFPREAMGVTLTELVAQLGVPARVELYQADGTTLHADIIQPEPPRSLFAPPVEPHPAPDAAQGLRGWLEFQAEGFVPGEDIDLAVVVAHSSASQEGTGRVLLDPQATVAGAAEVILLGRISGTTSVQHII